MKPVRSEDKVNALRELQSHTGMISASGEELYVFSPVKRIYFYLYSTNMKQLEGHALQRARTTHCEAGNVSRE